MSARGWAVPPEAWLFAPRADLALFLAPALAALALVPLVPEGGELPLPAWVVAVLLVDVAHVWATVHRTYLDPGAWRRRARWLVGAPLVAYAVGVALHLRSPGAFWTALAYLAVWHFVRQQYGWIALLHRRDPPSRADGRVDRAAIYGATLGPLVWWHAHLPRPFEWFMAGDFVSGVVSPTVGRAALALSWAALAVFVARQAQRAWRGEGVRLTKLVVVLTTFACWHVGIVYTASDWSFTVTNVLIHGVPYFGLVWLTQRREATGRLARWMFGGGRWAAYYLTLVAVAWLEEWGWDRAVWHEHPSVFPGPEVGLGALASACVVPLLALPQATHYLLDAVIWRRDAGGDAA